MRATCKSMSEDLNKSELLEALGAHLAHQRVEAGLTGAELARRCLVDRQAIDRIEKGNTNPTYFTLAKIAHSLGTTVGELLDGLGK